MSVQTIAGHQFQYSSGRHQADTAISGMWLFLATETLLFGALFLAWIFCRHWQQPGFDAGARQTDLTIGTMNTVILITSSAVYATGLFFLDDERKPRFRWCMVVTAALGAIFIVLKGVEWHEDFMKHLFPGPTFHMTGAEAAGAQLFFSFYFIATALHAVHMTAGIALVAWIAVRQVQPNYRVRAEIVGLYWSFVDMVWLILYPLIYLVGRG